MTTLDSHDVIEHDGHGVAAVLLAGAILLALILGGALVVNQLLDVASWVFAER